MSNSCSYVPNKLTSWLVATTSSPQRDLSAIVYCSPILVLWSTIHAVFPDKYVSSYRSHSPSISHCRGKLRLIYDPIHSSRSTPFVLASCGRGTGTARVLHLLVELRICLQLINSEASFGKELSERYRTGEAIDTPPRQTCRIMDLIHAQDPDFVFLWPDIGDGRSWMP